MGVTIHYEGSIEPERIPELEKFLKELCDEHNFSFRYGEFENEKGVVVTVVPDCPLWLAFDEKGRLKFFCKTQFAGLKVHVTVLAILKSVKDRFIPDMTIHDESGFWETRDFGKMADYFTESAVMFDELVEKLENKTD